MRLFRPYRLKTVWTTRRNGASISKGLKHDYQNLRTNHLPKGGRIMPNWVSNTIAFDKAYADQVIPVCCPNGEFDPLTVLPPDEEYDERGLARATAFSKVKDGDTYGVRKPKTGKNWCDEWLAASGYKFYEGRDFSGKILIYFESAWSPPAGIIEAFAKRFNIPFEYTYSELGMFFWGIEVFTLNHEGKSVLSVDRYSQPDDFHRCVGTDYHEFISNYHYGDDDLYEQVAS